MDIISTAFWILLGLFYLGVHLPYQEIAIGIFALVIGIVQLINLLKR